MVRQLPKITHDHRHHTVTITIIIDNFYIYVALVSDLHKLTVLYNKHSPTFLTLHKTNIKDIHESYVYKYNMTTNKNNNADVYDKQ